MLETTPSETSGIVKLFVQPDDGFNVVLAEIVEVKLGSVVDCQ